MDILTYKHSYARRCAHMYVHSYLKYIWAHPQINRAVFLAMSTGAICGTGALKATSPLKRALGSTTAANLAGLSLLLSVTSSERMLMRPRDIMLRAWRAISCFSASSFPCSFRIMVMYYLGNVVNRTRMKATHRVLSGLAGDEAQW